MLVCYTGGGTLGHIYPALAVHQALASQPGYSCFWIGRHNGLEQAAVEGAGIPFYPIQSGKLRRYASLANISDLFRLAVAFFQALKLLRKMRPTVLFSKGGFVSVPPVYAAWVLKIRVVTHESDASPGLATRLNSRCATTVCIPFAGSEGSLPPAKLVVTGNPIREALFSDEDISRFGIVPTMPVLLVLGGSQGSSEINALVRENLEALTALAFVIHQCGSADYQGSAHENYVAIPLLGPELGSLYRRSTLVVSRGGAGTIAEILAFGCASLIIPLSTATSRGDQILNAQRLVDKGAAHALFGEVSKEIFLQEVAYLLENPDKRGILAGNARALAVSGSAVKIASLLR
ncbi:UDP-N-acetylglucosamine--N-acetylmuramyl-(pentapeptide) pyrophosphoryl-undecaprenol N-acetylglucosamine transferase [Sphaerochaeta sp. PS]|uniref:UDP-N-acetylglucosamine--N-acetylmuramyl- (pentapeptide) pyrophosphoryl-undecaprenol N-acetylglucosamine transferase n=1 Tax=Sphaerochaeta sp. PS TaxID=3076336 RepID=UPI0028A3257F|nr:UDP-N-acetylglucosamine--N-acetylmuramyl-(pentapeptide) pyrophosphoryl-undecaprenol N-acetylglucosamine transferase [Sphaerochaeta sp. PS]MDT4762938.1 UDP-N-acetylglucosamine--N-acetylmuramyl-(pentapeptide) pyrophosphoryl-undecaprenol N-acetylglucosamine transferase [Sphaerochaeta sp. PS]